MTFLVKDSADITSSAKIYYHDIGDYLKLDEKFAKLTQFEHVGNTPFQIINPNSNFDWVNQRDPKFNNFLPLFVNSRSKSAQVFEQNSFGVKSNRDAWVYNFCKSKLIENVRRSMQYFNQELEHYLTSGSSLGIEHYVTRDSTKFAYTGDSFQRMNRELRLSFNSDLVYLSEYRPFTKMWLYFDKMYLNAVYQTPKFWLTSASRIPAICVHGPPASQFSTWFVNIVPDLGLLNRAYCYPFPTRRARASRFVDQVTLHDPSEKKTLVSTNISNGTKLFTKYYPNVKLFDEQVFHYVYGILQCPEYLDRFQRNLAKELPRIPAVQSVDEFMTFSIIGEKLAELQMNYEDAEEYPVDVEHLGQDVFNTMDPKSLYRVNKMKFINKNDRSSIQYNPYIRVKGIPKEAYEYQVSGRSLVEWVIDRQQVRIHKASGIVNDPNDFANETMNDPAYPLTLLKKAITVSIRSRELQSSMPPLRIHKDMGR